MLFATSVTQPSTKRERAMQIFIHGSDARLAECKRLLECNSHVGEALARRFFSIYLLPIPSRMVTKEEVRRLLSCEKENFCHEIRNEDLDRAGGVDARTDAEKTGGSLSDSGEGEGGNEGSRNEEDAPKRCLVVGYEVPLFLYEMDGVEVFDLCEEETFLWRNARLCALGMVGILLTEHTRVPSEMRVGVIGYGRIGKEVCDLLAFLETPLVVFTSNQEVVASLSEQGIAPVLVNWKEKCPCNVNQCLQNCGISPSLDILINTSPSPMGDVFYEGFFGTVYDLASGRPIPERVKHTRLASLPMRMYAQSAGVAVYRAIEGYLKKPNR